jgi:hypothetical protein
MSNPNFSALLQTNTSEIEKPKPMPAGHYQFNIVGHEFGQSSQKKTDYVQFNVNPLAAGSDVDEDLLAQVKNWQGKKMNVKYYITEDALWRLVEFLNMIGLDTEGRSLEELIPETVNMQCWAYIKNEISTKNPEETIAFIENVVAEFEG